MTRYTYQVGGSLKLDAPSYVERQADSVLYNALVVGEFCYVLNSRQMGKSSLRLRTKHRLQQAGMSCASIDMTRIGSKNITPQQWYKGIVVDLLKGFNLYGKVDLKTWWREREDLSYSQRVSQFIEEILLVNVKTEKLFIFIDEIDSVLSLNFPIDDFFALIRYCYNQRTENPEYNRLTWALFGVATPSDLIRDRNRTPFNIGKAIDLQGFRWHEVQPLVQGLVDKVNNPEAVLKEILTWTEGQPLLTQKLCSLIQAFSEEAIGSVLTVPPGTEAFWVESLVRLNVIENWEANDEPEHLKTIRDRILRNEQSASRLLGLYQQILTSLTADGEIERGGDGKIAQIPNPSCVESAPKVRPKSQNSHGIPTDDSLEQMDLLLSGLVVKKHGYLRVKNRIYQEVFNLDWVTQQLSSLRPYSQLLDTWVASDYRDESRLLRGQALLDAQAWAEGKSLSNLDYQFLAASQNLEKQEIQHTLEAERQAKDILAAAQQKANQTIRRGLIGLVGLSLAAVGLVGLAGFLSLQAAAQKQRTRISEITALTVSSKALLAANQEFDALLEGIRAGVLLQQVPPAQINSDLQAQVETVLQQAIYWVKESNRLLGHDDTVLSVSFSPDNQAIASSSREETIKLWSKDGKHLRTLRGHSAAVWAVVWSPDGQRIASTSEDKTVKLWSKDGKELRTLKGHQAWVVNAVFSPDGSTLATAGWDGTIRLWNTDGKELQTFRVKDTGFFDVAWSPDGSTLAAASRDGTIRLWSKDGKELLTIPAHDDWVFSVAWSPDGKAIASSSRDGTVKLWSLSERELVLQQTFEGHKAAVFRVRFSPDGSRIATASWDTTVKLWNRGGEELQTFRGHKDSVWNLGFSPDSKILATTSEDATVKLWSLSQGVQTFKGHESAIRDVTFSPDGSTIATAGMDMTVKIWSWEKGKMPVLQQTLRGFDSSVRSVSFSPDGSRIAIATWGSRVKVWSKSAGKGFVRQQILDSHKGPVWSVAVSPDGKIIASTSADKTVKLWSMEGKELQTLAGHQDGVLSVSFSPDGKAIASTSEDKTVKLWRWNDKSRSYLADATLDGFDDWVIGAGFTPDGKTLAAVGRNGTIKRWIVERGKMPVLQETLPGQNDSLWNISFRSDGKAIASASGDGTVKLLSLTGERLKTLRGHEGAVRSVSFSADGRMLASSDSQGRVILWDLDLDLGLQELLVQGCDWVGNYLKINPDVNKNDTFGTTNAGRHLCDEMKTKP